MRRDHRSRRLLLLALVPAVLGGCPPGVGPRSDGSTPATKTAAGSDAAPARRPPTHQPPAHRLPTGPALVISDVSFAGPAGHRPEGSFSRGETVLCLFTVANFTYKERRAHITVDLQVNGPEGQVVLLQQGMDLLKGEAPSVRPGTLRTAASITLSPASPPGRHEVRLSLTDRLSGRAGLGIGSFTLLGTPIAPVKTLTLLGLRVAGEASVPPGSVVPVAFELKGFASRKRHALRYDLDLGVETAVEDSAGQVLARNAETLLQQGVLFNPPAHPFEHAVVLPRDLHPGAYRIALKVKDRIGGGETTGLLRINVVPATLGVYSLHTHDAAGLPRDTFLLGEQIYVRLAVHGLTIKNDEVKAAVDLAVGGPGGVYFASKDAAATSGPASGAVARAGRYPLELPLVLPALSYTGKYQIVIRARDQHAGKQVVREHKISIQGTAPPPLASFRIDTLEVRSRPDLPPEQGDTFGAGRTYNLVLRLGGAKLKPVPQSRSTYRVKIKADLKLRIAGKVIHERKELFGFDKELTYKPLRMVIPANWEVPANLPGGLYDLEITALDLLDNHVSQFMRRVEIVAQPR